MLKKVTGFGKNQNTNTKRALPDNVYEMIRKRAYEVYLKRGSRPGDAMSDWLMAEKLVKRELRI